MEGKAEKLLKDLGRKIDKMLGDIDGSSGTVKEELNKRYEELKKSAHSLEDDLKNFKNKHQDKWDDLEAGIEKAGKEVKDAFSSAFGKKEDKTNVKEAKNEGESEDESEGEGEGGDKKDNQ